MASGAYAGKANSNSHDGLKHYGLGIVLSSSEKKTSRNDATAQRKAVLRCAVASLRETFCCCFGAEMPELPRVYAKLRIAEKPVNWLIPAYDAF